MRKDEFMQRAVLQYIGRDDMTADEAISKAKDLADAVYERVLIVSEDDKGKALDFMGDTLQYIMQAENELNGEQNYRIIKSDLQSAKETLEKAVHEMCGWLNFNELEGHRECAIDIAE